jgi:hypothetical protein
MHGIKITAPNIRRKIETLQITTPNKQITKSQTLGARQVEKEGPISIFGPLELRREDRKMRPTVWAKGAELVIQKSVATEKRIISPFMRARGGDWLLSAIQQT